MKPGIRRLVHWLLSIVIVVYIITGFGITQFRIMESLTLGLLTKNLSFMIHTAIVWPFLILLVLHVYYTAIRYRIRKRSG